MLTLFIIKIVNKYLWKLYICLKNIIKNRSKNILLKIKIRVNIYN